MHVARVGVLGPATAKSGDRDVVLAPSHRVLLAALVLFGDRGVSVDQLVDALWGPRPPRTAHRTLHSHLSRLRATLEGRVERPRAGTYELSADVAVDIGEFEREVVLAERARSPHDVLDRASRAQELWRGVPFTDLGEWPPAQPERNRLQELRDQLDELHVEALIGSGSVEAVARARALVDRAPMRERRWELLMTALYRDGRQADALEAFQGARRCLVEELGLEPGPGLVALERSVLRHDPMLTRWHAPTVSSTHPPAPAAGSVAALRRLRARNPLQGRDEEVTRLERAWATVRDTGRPALVIIEGEPGIGKTRLLAELASVAAHDGGRVHATRCSEDGLAGFQALLDAVGDPLAAAMPDRGEAGPLPTAQDLSIVCRRVALQVADLFGRDRGPMLLAVDDAQWADTSSLRALHDLVTVGHGAILVVLTIRTTDSSAPAAELARLRALRDDRADKVIVSLDEVDADSARRIVAYWQADGGAEDLPSPDEVVARSGGNPLHLVELARWRPAPDARLPATLVELTHGRLALLDPSGRALAEAGAVLGEVFDARVAAAMVDVDSVATPEAVEQVGRAGLWDSSSLATVHFAHAVTRDAVLATMPPARRSALEWSAGRLLEGSRSADAIARHLLAGVSVGDPILAARAVLAAARGARDELDPGPTLDLLAEAELLLGSTADDTVSTLIDVLLAKAQLLARFGRVSEAKSAALRASDMAERTGDVVTAARCAVGYAELVNAGEPDSAAPALCHAALRQLGEDHRAVAATVLAALANYHSVVLADPSTGRRWADRAVELAMGAEDDVVAEALWARGCAQLGSSQVTERAATADALLTHTRPGDRRHVEALRLAAHTHLELGDRRRAQQAATALGSLGWNHGSWDALLWSELWRSQFALCDGALDAAEEITDRVLEEVAGESLYALALASAQRCHQRLERGSLPTMLPLLEAVSATIDLPGTNALLAEALVQQGVTERAGSLVEPVAAAGFDDLPIDQTLTGALALLIDVSLALGRTDWAADAARRLSPYSGLLVVFLQGAVCFGAVDHHLGRVAAACGDLDRARRLLDAAERCERRTGAHLARLHTRLELAALDLCLGRTAAVDDLRRLREDADQRGLNRLRDSVDARLGDHPD